MIKDREIYSCSQLFISRSIGLRNFVQRLQRKRCTEDDQLGKTDFFTLNVIMQYVIDINNDLHLIGLYQTNGKGCWISRIDRYLLIFGL